MTPKGNPHDTYGFPIDLTREIADGAGHGVDMKPAPIAVWRALALEGVPAEQTVLIGDQVFTDVVAANLAGVRTILVHPQTRHDLWYTQLLRLVEEPILRDARFEGEDDSQSQARL